MLEGRWHATTCFTLQLPHRPGALAKLADALHAEGINLIGLWGYADTADDPRISLVPEHPDTFRHYARSNGIEADERRTMYLRDADRPGALVEALDRIAAVGINVDAIECVSAGDSFGWFLWAGASDMAALEELLR